MYNQRQLLQYPHHGITCTALPHTPLLGDSCPPAQDAAALERADSMPMSPTFYPTRMALHVGVLHYTPTQEPFPLLADPAQ